MLHPAISLAPSLLSAFFASLVEFIEALTVVLAVGTTRGWRSALTGTAVAAVVLAIIVVVVGSGLRRVPLQWMQLVIGALMLLFGMRWLKKAILRAGGATSLRNEADIFQRETSALATAARVIGFDREGFSAAFQVVMIEGLEVVFIVLAIGATGVGFAPPAIAAAAAGLLVVALGIALHKPLARIPENALKFGVGIILCAFGTFWVGEGCGLVWPDADWALLVLVIAFLLLAMVGVAVARSITQVPDKGVSP